MQQIEPELKSIGYQIIAISGDKSEDLRKTIDKSSLSYTLLSDEDLEGARALGIAWKSGGKREILPVPAVLVLNREAEIQFIYVNPNHKVRLDGAVLMAAARAALK